MEYVNVENRSLTSNIFQCQKALKKISLYNKVPWIIGRILKQLEQNIDQCLSYIANRNFPPDTCSSYCRIYSILQRNVSSNDRLAIYFANSPYFEHYHKNFREICQLLKKCQQDPCATFRRDFATMDSILKSRKWGVGCGSAIAAKTTTTPPSAPPFVVTNFERSISVPLPVPKSDPNLDERLILSKLAKHAILAKEEAYAPYSNFRVGAAILSEDGSIVTGCNVENVSYGLSICAERTAVVKAVSEGKRKFLAVAVTSDSTTDSTYPCGACRQFLREFGDYLFISVSCDGQKRTRSTTGQLLPHAFLPENLATEKEKMLNKF